MSFGSSQERYRPFGETLGISGKAVQDSFEGGGGESLRSGHLQIVETNRKLEIGEWLTKAETIGQLGPFG